jgi:hypothetical protein
MPNKINLSNQIQPNFAAKHFSGALEGGECNVSVGRIE